MNKQLYKGPVNDRLISEAHARNITCLKVKDDNIVTGGADHSVNLFSLQQAKLKREYHSKQYGHAEWITCLDFTCDGRILSGAMDNKLCLWSSTNVSCTDLQSHTSSISCLQCHEKENIALSGSYDCTMKIWDLESSHCITTFDKHSAPIISLFWKNSLLIGGSKDGQLSLWDVNQSQSPISMFNDHRSSIVKVVMFEEDNCFASCSTDGSVILYDLRQGQKVKKIDFDTSVNDILQVLNQQFVCADANGKIKLVDMKKFGMTDLQGHKSAITKVTAFGDLLFSGGANGWILVHNLTTRQCLYGIGVCENVSVTGIELVPDYNCLVAAGEDGNILLFDYV